MACALLAGENVVYCVWGNPRINDMLTLLDCVRSTAKSSGRPIVYITRVPVDAPAPNIEVRNFVNSIMPELACLCSGYHVVLEGTGFRAAIKRGILIALFQFGRKRHLFHVHATIDDVPAYVPIQDQGAVVRLLGLAKEQGLLHCTPQTIAPG